MIFREGLNRVQIDTPATLGRRWFILVLLAWMK